MLLTLAMLLRMLWSTAAENAAAAGVIRYRISILWFLMFAIVGTWLLVRTQFGNWIFAVGGNKEAARSEGIPAARTEDHAVHGRVRGGVAERHADRLPAQLGAVQRRRR